MRRRRGCARFVIEGTAPGGQAGTSSKIENYLGFPTGISGQRLASRAQLQALKFGVRFAISREVVTAEQVGGDSQADAGGRDSGVCAGGGGGVGRAVSQAFGGELCAV